MNKTALSYILIVSMLTLIAHNAQAGWWGGGATKEREEFDRIYDEIQAKYLESLEEEYDKNKSFYHRNKGFLFGGAMIVAGLALAPFSGGASLSASAYGATSLVACTSVVMISSGVVVSIGAGILKMLLQAVKYFGKWKTFRILKDWLVKNKDRIWEKFKRDAPREIEQFIWDEMQRIAGEKLHEINENREE